MSEAPVIRLARADEAEICADIKWDWMQSCDWMPDQFSREGVRNFFRDRLCPACEVWIAGSPAQGFLALEADDVSQLYVAEAHRGRGVGKALLDHVKGARRALELWAFQANAGALAFYGREGFHEVRATEGDNMEGLPDVLLRWEAA